MGGINLDDYVDVAERIAKFHEKYPEGSLRCAEWGMQEVGGQSFVFYRALAYRNPDDQAPAEGTAWEPVPGKTPFTKDSELMNAETSAWGRAIAALGFEVRNGIASKQDVQNRPSNGGGDPNREATEKQREWATDLILKADFSDDQLGLIREYCRAESGGFRAKAASFLIEQLKDGDEAGREHVLKIVGWSDAPAVDTTDFESDGKEAPAEDPVP